MRCWHLFWAALGLQAADSAQPFLGQSVRVRLCVPCIVWGVHMGMRVHVWMDVLWTVWGVCVPCGCVCCGLGRYARVHGVYPPCSTQV